MGTTLTAVIIVASDRVSSGEREDASGPLAQRLLAEAGIAGDIVIVEEGFEAVSASLADARANHHRLILTVGGTGLGPRNQTPEATEPLLAVVLTGLMTQILLEGLAHSPCAGLSRALIGLTGRGPDDALIINSPSSKGAVRDTLGVVVPLLPNIFERLS